MKRHVFDVFTSTLLAYFVCTALGGPGSMGGNESESTGGMSSQKLVGCNRDRFPLPKGWRHNISGDDIGLAADNMLAWMVIYPHEHERLADLELDIQQEPRQGDMKLTLQGEPKRISENAIAIDFSGWVSGVRAKAHLVGTLSPHSGGVFIFAVTSSDESFAEVSNTADDIARRIQY